MNTLTQEKTPFEKAGYTKDTKFRVVSDTAKDYGVPEGSVVWLAWDDGTKCPFFTRGGSKVSFLLPGVCNEQHLKVIQEDTAEDEDSYPNIQVKLSAVDKTPTYRVHFNEMYHRDLSKAEAEEIYSLLGIVLNKN